MHQSVGFTKDSSKPIAVAILVAIYIAINLFRIGGNDFIINLNNFVVAPLALAVTIYAVLLWRELGAGSENRWLWGGLALGWGLWTAAEWWWAIASLLGHEVPYPSWPDVLWLAGYVPIYAALLARGRGLPRIATRARRTLATGTSLLFLAAATILVFIPVFRSNDPSAFLESALNVLYPLADVVMMLLALQLLFTYQQGVYGRAWYWLTAGFVAFSIGDLAFTYANAANLYYPDHQVNLISTLGADVPYNLSYLIVLVGLILRRRMEPAEAMPVQADAALVPVANTHVLVYTKADDTITNISANYASVFADPNPQGNTISEALAIPAKDTADILMALKTDSVLAERMFPVSTQWGQIQAGISGIEYRGPQGSYDGVLLVVRLLSDDPCLDDALSKYEKEMLASLIHTTGTDQKEASEIARLLGGFYQEHFKALRKRIISESGSAMAEQFAKELFLVVKQHGWHMNILPDAGLDVSSMTLSDMQEALPILLGAAQGFVARFTDLADAEQTVRDVNLRVGEAMFRNISGFMPSLRSLNPAA